MRLISHLSYCYLRDFYCNSTVGPVFHPTTHKEGTGYWVNETQVCMMRSATALYVSPILCAVGGRLMGTGPTKAKEGDQGTKVQVRTASHLYLCCHKYVPQVQPDVGGPTDISQSKLLI